MSPMFESGRYMLMVSRQDKNSGSRTSKPSFVVPLSSTVRLKWQASDVAKSVVRSIGFIVRLYDIDVTLGHHL